MLPTKYQGSRPYGFRQEYFYMFFSLLEFKESDVAWPNRSQTRQICRIYIPDKGLF